MTGRIPGKGLATGAYWGRNPRCNIEGYQIPDKIAALAYTQLQAGGRPAVLYLPVEDGPTCTCTKDTSLAADRQCRSCYGVGLVPGFELFLRDTYHFSSAEAASYVLSDTVVDTRLKPNRVILSDTALSGTIETTDITYTNPLQETWYADVQVYERPNTTSLVEVSTDSGGNWTDLITWLGTVPAGTGTLRLRITLTRTSLDDESPEFEIVRMRHLRAQDISRAVVGTRTTDYAPGDILILRPGKMYQNVADAGRGGLVESPAQRAWTVPLNGFDSSILAETVEARIPTPIGDPHPFIELRYGLAAGQRFALVDLSPLDELLRFTRQSWNERRIQPDEIWSRVW